MMKSLKCSLFGIVALLASATFMPQWVIGGELEGKPCKSAITSCPADTMTVSLDPGVCEYVIEDLRDQVEVDLCSEGFSSCIDQMPAPGSIVGIGDTVITFLAYECDIFDEPAFGDPTTCANDEACSLITGSCTTTLTVEPPAPMISCDGEVAPLNLDQNCQYTVPDLTGLVTVDACPGTVYTLEQMPAAGTQGFWFGGDAVISVSIPEFDGVSCNYFVEVLPVAVCPTSDKLVANGPDDCMAELQDYCDAYLPACQVVGAAAARGDQDFPNEFICEQNPPAGTMLEIGATDVTLTIRECFFQFPGEAQARGVDEECLVRGDLTCTFPVEVNAPPAELICEQFFTTLDPVVLGDDCLFVVPDVTGEFEVSACDGAEFTVVQDPLAGTEITIDSTSYIIRVSLDQSMSQPCFVEIPFNPVQSCPDSPQTIAYDENCEATIPDLTGQVDIMDCCEEFVSKGEQRGGTHGGSFCGEIRITQDPPAGDPLTEPTEVTITVERCLVFDQVLSDAQLQRGLEEEGDGCDVLDTCVVMLNPIDDTPPTFTCPDDLAINADENCMGVVPDVTGVVDASDNCTAATDLTITQDPAAGTVIGLGTTLFTVTVTDAAGNTETCTVMVELLENGCMDEPPAPDPGEEEPGAPQPVPGCDEDTQSLNLLFSLLFHSPVCGATCPLMLAATLCGMMALRLGKRRRNR